MIRPPSPGRYCVLGASGLVGSHLLSALAGCDGIQVRAVCHRRRPVIEHPCVEVVSADLTVPARARDAVAGCDVVLIAAGVLASSPVLARDPVGPVLANLRIATTALEAAWTAGVTRCLWVSSTTGYPAVEGVLDEDRFFEGEPPPGWRGLGEMTRFVEKQAKWYAEQLPRSMPVALIRPTLVYGEHDHFDDDTAHFLPALIRRVVARETPIEVWGTGEQSRDLIHAADVARAALAALWTVEGCRAWTIGAGESYSVNACFQLLLDLDGFTDAQVVHRLDKPTSVGTRRFDTSRAARELGFRPVISLREGLRRTLAWYRAQAGRSGAEERAVGWR